MVNVLIVADSLTLNIEDYSYLMIFTVKLNIQIGEVKFSTTLMCCFLH